MLGHSVIVVLATTRMWNDEFARHGIPHRVDSTEDEVINLS